MASIWKFGAGILSAGAALVSILSSTSTFKNLVGSSTRDLPIGPEARRAGLAPSADTATSLGDSIQLAVTVTDARGAALTGITPAWISTDESIASVDQGGTVVARGAGVTTVVVSVGRVVARSRITVRQEPAGIRLGDSVVRLREGERAPLPASVVDARGAGIQGATVAWRTSDAAIIAVDSVGQAMGMIPGEATLTAVYGEHQAGLRAEVLAVPEADPVPERTRVTLLTEDLIGPAGDTLKQPVAVRVTDSSGAALADVPAAWSTPDGGNVAPLGARTDSLGEARARWKLGPKAGRQRVQVQIGNARTMPIFTARATGQPGPAASISVRSGDGQVRLRWTLGRAAGSSGWRFGWTGRQWVSISRPGRGAARPPGSSSSLSTRPWAPAARFRRPCWSRSPTSSAIRSPIAPCGSAVQAGA